MGMPRKMEKKKDKKAVKKPAKQEKQEAAKTDTAKPVKKPVRNDRLFISTIFTDGKKSEINRYRKYIAKLQKHNQLDSAKVTRYKPTIVNGLSEEQVSERINAGYSNYTHRGSTKTYSRILFTNFFTAFNIICIIAAGLVIWAGLYWSTSFLAIMLANLLIGIIQEIKAKRIIEKLSLVASSKVKAIRTGEKCEILIDDVVLDDVIILSTGQQIPADSVVMDGMIEANESLLTGESAPITKQKGDKVLAGSFVVSGTCMVQVHKVGKENYVQNLAQGATRYVRPKSELLNSLRLLIKILSVIMLALFTMYVIRQVTGSEGINRSTIGNAVGMIIGMLPAGMFLLTSLVLTVGVINLAKSRTLVQELYCIEMLARADTLCLDKTGTITNGTMKVCDIIEVKNSSSYTIREIITSMVFALDDNNQTSIALQDHFGSQMILKATNMLPFSSSRKMSAVSFEEEGTYFLGAPEFILKEKNERVEERIKRFASQGLRVLMLARAQGQIKNGKIPEGAKPVAIITLQDQIRKEAPETIAWFRNNGVDIRVISGDNPMTVSEVAKRAGVAGAEKFISLEGMSPIEVRNVARDYTVFGRVSPEQKLILVKEFKNQGRTVAMTGDGVNDILALREADCSIAMAAGAEAARNVSHLVLLDSNFASMPKVVAQGRRAVNNVQRTSSIFLFKSLFVMLISCFVIITGEIYPFIPQNMILIEFFVIGVPSFLLALEINDSKLKGRFMPTVLRAAFAGGLVILINVIVLYMCMKIGNAFTISADEFRTMLIYSTTITGLFMLWKVVLPLNLFRAVLMVVMTVLIGIAAYFGGSIVGVGTISAMNIMLLIIILLISYPMIAFINGILSKIRIDHIPIINKLTEKMDK